MSEQIEKIEEPKESLKPCFIITPIGELNSDSYKDAMGLIDAVMEPVLKSQGYIPIPANRMSKAGSINNQVIKAVFESELAIANLTGVNPNVMYELAVRHSFKKKVITMAEHGTELPFDVKPYRTIFYHNTLHGVEAAKSQLKDAILSIEEAEEISNPVIDALNQAAVINSIPTGGDSEVLKYIVGKLDRLEAEINSSYSKRERSRFIANDEPEYIIKLVTKRASEIKSQGQISEDLLKKSIDGIKIMKLTFSSDGPIIILRFSAKSDLIAASFRSILLNTDYEEVKS